MPPPYRITPDQRRTLDALEWLYDEGEGRRRQGRTWVLAISYIRRLVLSNVRGLDVEDHVQTHTGASVLMGYILAIAEELDLEIEVNRGRSHIRLAHRPVGRHLEQVTVALTSFGHREPAAPPEFRTARMERGVLKTTKREEPAPVSAPTMTLWDHLHDDSDGI